MCQRIWNLVIKTSFLFLFLFKGSLVFSLYEYYFVYLNQLLLVRTLSTLENLTRYAGLIHLSTLHQVLPNLLMTLFSQKGFIFFDKLKNVFILCIYLSSLWSWQSERKILVFSLGGCYFKTVRCCTPLLRLRTIFFFF